MVKHASALNAPPPLPPPPNTVTVPSSSMASPQPPAAAKQQPQPVTTTGARLASPQQQLKPPRSWLDWARGEDKKPVAGQPAAGQTPPTVSFTERYFGADGKVCA